jgi:arylsulfatase
MSGKWHVTKHIGPWTAEPDRMSKDNWPIQRGFDRFYGTITGAGSFFDPNTLTNDSDPAPPASPGFYYTDAISDSAATFIRQHEEDTPFFLYVAHTAPHWPLHAFEEDIAKYEGRYDAGWDELREERYSRLLEMGLLDPSSPLSERDEQVPSWQSLSDQEQAWYARAMEVYAAQVDRMDQGIGRVLDALEQTGQMDNTLIVFLSDNGACAEVLTDEWQGPYLRRQTRAGRKVTVGNEDKRVLPGAEETFMSYGRGWANASNTPFKLFKHDTYEGGISSPFIVHWPEGLDQSGRTTDQRSQLIDLMATFVDVSGAAYPKTFNGQRIAGLPGKSLTPIFQGGGLEDRPLFFEHEGNRAVFLGDWKLVAQHGRPWSLYQIRQDRTEVNDVAADHPEIAAALLEQYEAWATENYVLAWPARESALAQTAQ